MKNTNGKYCNYIINENYFDNIDTEEKAYFLGFLYADCHIKNNKIELIIHEDDNELLIKLRNALYPNKDRPISRKFIASIKSKKKIYIINRYYGRLAIMNKHMADQLKKHGLIEGKHNREIPKLKSDLLNHFIRGYYDGDGSLSYIWEGKYLRNHLQLCILPKLGKDIHSFIYNKYKIDLKISKSKSKHLVYFSGVASNTIILLNNLYQNANIFLKRKYNKYLEFQEEYQRYVELK